MKHLCATVGCDRYAMRTRDGQRFCLYHPGATPPPMDLLTGRLRHPDKATSLIPQQRNARAGSRAGGLVPAPRAGRKPCAREGCERPAQSLGLCKPHYNTARQRARRAGARPCDCPNGRCAACRARSTATA